MNNDNQELKENEIKNDEKIEKNSQNIDAYIPEQLDDEDFEKEKEELKRLKREKKLAKKNKKAKNEDEQKLTETSNISDIKDDEDKFLEKKKSKKKIIITIVAIILLVVLVIGGIVGFLLINMNKPENVVKDFVSYYNEQNWNELVNCIDFKGYYALCTLEEKDYTQYDECYNKIEENEYYPDFKEYIENRLEHKDEIFKTIFAESKMIINEINGIEKIENTKNLYKIRVNITLTVEEQQETQQFNIFVAKNDKKYKLVGGEFPALIDTAFQYSLYYGI